MTYYQFLILQYLLLHTDEEITYRQISDDLLISNSLTMKEMDDFVSRGLITKDKKLIDKGMAALEPYKVKKAVILAAGFGSRKMPATAEHPKPMVTVNGRRIISTLLDALRDAGVKDITIVREYKEYKKEGTECNC